MLSNFCLLTQLMNLKRFIHIYWYTCAEQPSVRDKISCNAETLLKPAA